MQTLRKFIRPAILIILAILVIASMFIPIASQVASAEGSAGVSSVSMYERGSEIARNFATALAPGSDMGTGMVQDGGEGGSINAGQAGGFLGYADYMSDDEGIKGWITSQYTATSATITYDQLENIIPVSGGDMPDIFSDRGNPWYQYAGYGEMLTEMGLIGATRSSGLDTVGRVAATSIVMIVYLLANAAPFLFSIALTMLDILNPFKLFFYAFEGMGNTNMGLISGVAQYISDIYLIVQDFSMYILFPLLLVITIMGALVFTKTSALKRFMRYFVRIFMLFAGLPLIGAMYTGVIEDLNKEVKVGAEYADYLVLSSYVDFENWARNTRLAVPESRTPLTNPRTSTGTETHLKVPDRELVLGINGPYAGHKSATTLKDNYGDEGLGDVFRDTRGRTTVSDDSGGGMVSDSIGQTLGLLMRHAGTALYSGSQYDGEVSGLVQKERTIVNPTAETDEDAEDEEMSATEVAILKMFTLTGSENRTWTQQIKGDDKWAKAVDWNEGQGLFTDGAADNEPFQFGEYTYNIYNAGGITGGGYYDNSVGIPDMSADDAEPLPPIGSEREGTVGGLSPLSMYNFLNTTFSDTGLTVYSPEQTITDSARDTYASVVFASTGVSSMARWIENVVVMGSLAALSIAYGMIMISAAIKNIPRILSGVFGTALGSIAFTAKLLISTAVMLVQIIGMILLYFLSETILMSIIMNMNSFTVDLEAAFGGAGVMIEFARSAIVTIIVLIGTIFMIKNVNIVKEMFEEVVTNAINKMMGLLDTSTGGEGLSAAQTSGGRVGNDGKLSQDTKDADANNSLLGGVGNIMKDAHGIEAKREQMAQEENLGERSIGDKIGQRMKTAKDLAGAKAKDAGKRPFAKDPQSYQREMDAKERSVRQTGNKGANGVDDEYKDKYGFKKPEDKSTGSAEEKAKAAALNGDTDAIGKTNALGQIIDDNGNIVNDPNGQAMDKNGKAISSETPLGKTSGGFGSSKVDTDENGMLLNADGDAFRDENGNAFYQDEDGQLVDEDGNYMALDKDGTIQPLDSIPGHDGKTEDADIEAEKLNLMRKDAGLYEEMQAAQASSHYGMSEDGAPTDADGNGMTYMDEDGNEQVAQLDDDGFVTDNLGNRLDRSDINGPIDDRGFSEIEDPETGETYLQHDGDAAMKETLSRDALDENADMSKPESLTNLAKESAKANALADAAESRVDALKEEGGSPYAIAQAERAATKLRSDATKVDKKLNAAMQGEGKKGGPKRKPVTKAQVDSANRNAQKQKATLKQEEAKMTQLKADGASPQAIARQERKLDAQRKATQTADNTAKDAATANVTGRPMSEVTEARDRVERAEEVFEKALDAQAAGKEKGLSGPEMQKLDKNVEKASGILSKANNNQERTQHAPQGSAEQIDKAEAAHETAKEKSRQASAKVEEMERASQPMTAEKSAELKQTQATAQQTMDTTRKAANRHGQAQQQERAAADDVSRHAKTVDTLTRRGAAPEKVQAATQKLNNAKQRQSEARNVMSKTSDAATTYKQAEAKHTKAGKQLDRAGTPMTAEESRSVKHTQAASQAKMQKLQPEFDNYKRAQSTHKNSKKAFNQASKRVATLKKQGAPAAEIQQAQASVKQAQQKMNQASELKRNLSGSATEYRDAQTTHAQATKRLDNSQPTVSHKEVEQARREEKQAKQHVAKTSRQREQVNAPKGWKGHSPTGSSSTVPTTSPSKSFTKLAASGINNYGDYKQEVTKHQSSINDSKQRLNQAEQRMKEQQKSKRPAQIINQTKSEIVALKKTIGDSNAQLKDLQDNAHGLVRNGGFQPPGVASRPIRQSGAITTKHLDATANTQAIYDKLSQQLQQGTITARDKKRLKILDVQLEGMKSELISSGVDPSVVKDKASLTNGKRTMDSAWKNFVDGKGGSTGGGTTGKSSGRNNRGPSRGPKR